MNFLFTHNDLDGVACGIIARCAFGDDVDVRYNSVSSLDAQISRFLEKHRGKAPRKGGLVFVTDLTVNADSEAGLSRYVGEGGKVRLLDHHKTALHLNRHAWASVQLAYDDGRLTSAASLLYEYFVQHGLLKTRKALAQFVELVRQYDTWEWEKNGNVQAKRLNDLFFLTSLDEFEDMMVERVKRDEDFAFTEFEQKLLDIEEDKIERYVRRKRRELVQTFVGERCVGIVYAESYHSELGATLGKEYPHLDYIAILNPGSKKISLRTVHDHVDVSEVAGEFGGGGHAKAAGCPMSEAAFSLYAAEPFPQEPLRGDAFKNQYNVKGSPYGVLYESRNDDWLFLFTAEGRWFIDANEETLDESFETFEAAERHVKRQYAAWLARDEAFVQYLMKHASKR
ncbi:oligoribonuclease [Paenibacillus sp. TRM 82003]|nr:oligoribonuclease [Paenibacillus sp. TRM 82003]